MQSAKTEGQEFKLSKENVNLHSIVKEVADSFAMNIKNLDGTLELKLDATKHIVLADKQHLSNVVSNLVDNATKYSGEKPAITISTYNEGGKLYLSVADKGVGISKEYRKKIFDKFFRVPSGNIHNVKGFGLGLSYVKNIVHKHKWKIKLESELGKGSNFIIAMPTNV